MGSAVITITQTGAPVNGTADWGNYSQEAGSQEGGTPSTISFGAWSISDSAWAALDNGTSCGTTADTCNVERSRSRTQNYNDYTYDGVRTCNQKTAAQNGGNQGTCSNPFGNINDIDHEEDHFSVPRPPTPLSDQEQDKDVVNLAKVFTATYNLTNSIIGTEYELGTLPAQQSGTQSDSYSFNHPTVTANDGFEFSSGPTFTSNSGSDSLSGNFSDRSNKTISVTVTGHVVASTQPLTATYIPNTTTAISNVFATTGFTANPAGGTGSYSYDWEIVSDGATGAFFSGGSGSAVNSVGVVAEFPGTYVIRVTISSGTEEIQRQWVVQVMGSFPSKAEYKKNSVLVGASPSGIPIWEFEYIKEVAELSGLPGRYRGVMVEDVLEHTFTHDNELTYIDYQHIDVNFEEIE